MISSRLRCGIEWRDALIFNVSSRGAGLSGGSPPDPGSYVEIRRGAYLIVARVIWVNGVRFGVRTQDRIPVDSLVRQPDAAAVPPPENDSSPPRERRRVARTSGAHERSRLLARALEFAFLALFGASAAFAAFGAARQVLGQPLDSVRQALSK